MYLVAVNPRMQEELVGLPVYHASAISDPIEMTSATNWPSLRMKTPKSPRHNHDARVNGCYSPLTLARLLTLTLAELGKLQKNQVATLTLCCPCSCPPSKPKRKQARRSGILSQGNPSPWPRARKGCCVDSLKSDTAYFTLNLLRGRLNVAIWGSIVVKRLCLLLLLIKNLRQCETAMTYKIHNAHRQCRNSCGPSASSPSLWARSMGPISFTKERSSPLRNS